MFAVTTTQSRHCCSSNQCSTDRVCIIKVTCFCLSSVQGIKNVEIHLSIKHIFLRLVILTATCLKNFLSSLGLILKLNCASNLRVQQEWELTSSSISPVCAHRTCMHCVEVRFLAFDCVVVGRIPAFSVDVVVVWRPFHVLKDKELNPLGNIKRL